MDSIAQTGYRRRQMKVLSRNPPLIGRRPLCEDSDIMTAKHHQSLFWGWGSHPRKGGMRRLPSPGCNQTKASACLRFSQMRSGRGWHLSLLEQHPLHGVSRCCRWGWDSVHDGLQLLDSYIVTCKVAATASSRASPTPALQHLHASRIMGSTPLALKWQLCETKIA